MSKDKPEAPVKVYKSEVISEKFEHIPFGFVPLFYCFCCGLTLTGCQSMVTEAAVKVCVVEPGKTLPPECFTPRGTEVSKDASLPDLE